MMKYGHVIVTVGAIVCLWIGAFSCGTSPEAAERRSETAGSGEPDASTAPTLIVGTAIEASTGLPLRPTSRSRS